MEKQIGGPELRAWRAAFDADPLNRMRQNCLAHTDIKQVTLDQNLLVKNRPCFSCEVAGGTILAQNKTGRCWTARSS